jgi:hypothetical protein
MGNKGKQEDQSIILPKSNSSGIVSLITSQKMAPNHHSLWQRYMIFCYLLPKRRIFSLDSPKLHRNCNSKLLFHHNTLEGKLFILLLLIHSCLPNLEWSFLLQNRNISLNIFVLFFSLVPNIFIFCYSTFVQTLHICLKELHSKKIKFDIFFSHRSVRELKTGRYANVIEIDWILYFCSLF